MNGQTYLGNSWITGQTDLQDAISQQLYNVKQDINMQGHNIINLKNDLTLNQPDTNVCSVGLVKEYFVQGGGGGPTTLPSDLQQYNVSYPLQSDLSFVNSSKDVLVKDTQVVDQSKKVVNANTLYQTKQQLSTDLINTQNLLQNEIDTLAAKTLDQIPIAQHTVNINQQSVDNLLSIKQGGNPQLYFNPTQQQIRVYQPMYRYGTHPSQIDNSQYITKEDYDTLISQTPISNILPNTTTDPIADNQYPVVWNQSINKLVQSSVQLTDISTKSALDQEVTDRTDADQVLQDQIDGIPAEYYNKTEIDLTVDDLQGQINNKLSTSTTLNQIQKPTASVDFNGKELIHIGNGLSNDSGISLGQLLTAMATVYTKTQVDSFVSDLQQQIDQITTDGVTLQELNTILTDYVTNTALSTQLLSYVTLTQLTTALQPYLKTVDYNTVMQSYYTKSDINTILNDYASKSYLQQYYYTSTQTDSAILSAITLLENVYVSQTALSTILQNYYTKTQTDTAISTALQSYSTTTTNDSKYYWSSNLPSQISHSSNNCSLQCSGSNQINIKANGNTIGSIFQPTGQATTPLGIQSSDKIQLQSGMNSFSCYGSNTTPVNGLVYNALRSQVSDNPTNNCYSAVEVLTSSSSNGSCMTLSSGHANILGDGVQRPFMSLADQNNNAFAFGISPRNPVLSPTDTQYNMYPSANATALSLFQHSFKGTAGYDSSISITQPNQFVSKTYVDTNSVSVNTSSLTNYYTKTVSDGKYQLLTTTLNNIPLTTGSIDANSQKIINLASPTLSNDAVNKAYADSLVQPVSQQYPYINTTPSSGWVTIGHNLGSDIDGLSFDVYIKHRASQNGYTASQWIYQGTLDRSITSAGVKFGIQITSNTTNILNSCKLYLSDDGFGLVAYNTNNFNSPLWADLSLKIIVKKTDKFLVLSSQYATSNLIVNSDIDLLNTQYIDNCPNPTTNLQVANKQYVDGLISGYQTQTQADARYYRNTVTLNNITAPNGSVNMSGQKITGLGLATANTDAVSLTQLNNYTPTSIYSADLSTNVNCNNSNSITILGNIKAVGNIGLSSYQHIFNSSSSGVSTPSVGSCMLINDQISQTNTTTPRYALMIQSSNTNTTPQAGYNGAALIAYGISYIAQRAGANQTSSTELLLCEGQVRAPGFIQSMPSRQEFKRDIQPFTVNQSLLNVNPVSFFYDQNSQFVQDKGLDTNRQLYGFVYEDIQQACPNNTDYFLDQDQLNTSAIHRDMLYTLWLENRQLKSVIQQLSDRITQVESRLQ